ncbi:putative nuclear envelope protein [Diaporthe ampelina]|uniref:Putative nuclear envelope protein n=1 Tax=Diaporthe ampelina TaxID=1214573 RepID=A0A0G2I5I1_9PEZI|nr:putative nuclear envelope protein [Diaporthe ampelina]
MAPVRRAPYKDFLQPALHRRFTSTATILLAIAFVEAVVLASWDSLFWAVFPVGPTGIRTFFIFLCGLAVLVLRIAQYHVGLRTSNSGLQTFLQYAVTPQTLEAVVSYTLSSWIFSQIYLRSATEDLAWVSIQPGVGGRVRLNEKPIFFTVHFLVLGVVHGALHIFRDEDRLRLSCFATWELALIARDFQPRRQAIYQDIDRKDGPVWSQVYTLCLQAVTDMESRIDEHSKAAAAAKATAAKVAESKQQALVQTPTKTFRDEMDDMVRRKIVSPGQPSRLSPLVQKGVAHAKDYVEDIARQATGPDAADNPFQYWTRQVLASPLGRPFTQSFSRRITTVVLGEPYGEPSLVINAISALTRLAVLSLAEDSYGNVQRDVSSIIRTFTAVKTKLDTFKADFPLHWTDHDAARECAEVDAILDTLKEGLVQLVTAFGPYARDLRLTFADLRHAREAAGLPGREGGGAVVARVDAARPEMRQIR